MDVGNARTCHKRIQLIKDGIAEQIMLSALSSPGWDGPVIPLLALPFILST
jgi:hypothetical protein